MLSDKCSGEVFTYISGGKRSVFIAKFQLQMFDFFPLLSPQFSLILHLASHQLLYA